MPFYENGEARIRYEEYGNPNGHPLLLLAPGGPNSCIAFWDRMAVSTFDPRTVFAGEYRIIGMDQRNAPGGESTGPVQVENPWTAFVSDQLGLLDHLGISEAFVLGFCIGGSFILNLMEAAPSRITAGVLCQPIGHRPEEPDLMYDATVAWGKELAAKRPDVTETDIEKMATNMYRSPADFVYSVSKDFVSTCQVPMLVLPGIDSHHPHWVGVEVAELAPNGEMIDPWKQPELMAQAVEGIREYLQRHTPVSVK
jgi:pimeloyl-ACP methyl ester carboxylesterase